MADLEVIDDSSSQEALPPSLPVKKKGKTKRDAAVVPPSNTLTRFLEPPAAPSLSAWEDVNLQCPVCQRTGFSSRGLAFHVNHCLDVTAARKPEGAGADVQRDAKESGGGGGGDAGGGNIAVNAAGREVKKPASNGYNSAAGSRSRKGVAGVSRAAVDRSVVKAVDCEEKPPSDNTGKKSKSRHPHPPSVRKRSDPCASKPGVSHGHRQAVGHPKSRSRPRQPRLSSPTQLSSPGATQSAPGRRRGVLSRPRGSVESDAAAAPHASAVDTVQKEIEELALGEIARTQLMCVLETERGRIQHGGWLGTQLFPKPTADDSLVVNTGCGACRGGCDGVVRTVSYGEPARGLDVEGRVTGSRPSRVRRRPASWDLLPRTGLGMWPRGFDDCWGDGDGYLTLRPFPSREGLAGPGVLDSGGERGVRRDDDDAQLGSNGSDDDSAPASRAEKFLSVFATLQPARRALNLLTDVSVPPLSAAGKTEEYAASAPSRSAAGGSVNIECSKGSQVVTQLGSAVPANGGVGEGSGDAKTATIVHTKAKADGLSTPTAKRLKIEVGARASDSIENKQGMEASTADNNRSLRETGWENNFATPSSREPRWTGPVSAREPALRQTSERRQPAVNPDDQRHPTQRPSINPQVGSENCQVKQVTDVIEMTSESPTPPRSAAGVGGAADVNFVTGGMQDASCRLRETSRGMKMPVKDSASRKESTPPLPSERPRQRRPDAVLSPSAATPACPRSSGETHASRPPDTPMRPRATTHRAADPPPREINLRGSSGARSRLEALSVNVKRGAHVLAIQASASTADIVQVKRTGGHSQLGMGSTKKISGGQWNGSKLRGGGAFASALSSGVLRSADASAGAGCGSSGDANGGVNGEAPEAAGVKPVQLPAGDATVSASQGRKADVAQKGSLTVVDAKHGATIRNSWSIDESDELGRLEFGVSLKYDAVWYFPPADDDCVGVLRYRLVPHPFLAPKGGWISEQGRLRSDPRIIVKATPAATPPPVHARPSAPQLASGSCQRRDNTWGEARQGGGGIVRSSTIISQSSQDVAHLARRQQNRAERCTTSTRAEQEAGSIQRTQSGSAYSQASQAWKSKESARQAERHQPRRKTQGNHHTVTAAAGGSCRTPSLSAGSPEASQTRGSFGRATSPSPKVLEHSDTGDKVKCPLCHRGMDHWKARQRQQHVHGCLLKQPSSAKKAAPAAVATAFVTPRTERSAGISSRSTVLSRGSAGSSSGTPTPDSAPSHWRDSGAEGAGESRSVGRGGCFPAPTEGPRPMRVSLQGVFSPKAAREVDRMGHRPREPGNAKDSTASRHTATATTARPKNKNTTSGMNNRQATDKDTRANRISNASRGGVEMRTDKKASATKGLEECPICRLSFAGGRLGQWERQAHIQQCLDGLEGVFGSGE